MAELLAGGQGVANDQAIHWFGNMFFDVVCSDLFRCTANLTNQYDLTRLGVLFADAECLGEIHALHGVTADAKHDALSDTFSRQGI